MVAFSPSIPGNRKNRVPTPPSGRNSPREPPGMKAEKDGRLVLMISRRHWMPGMVPGRTQLTVFHLWKGTDMKTKHTLAALLGLVVLVGLTTPADARPAGDVGRGRDRISGRRSERGQWQGRGIRAWRGGRRDGRRLGRGGRGPWQGQFATGPRQMGGPNGLTRPRGMGRGEPGLANRPQRTGRGGQGLMNRPQRMGGGGQGLANRPQRMGGGGQGLANRPQRMGRGGPGAVNRAQPRGRGERGFQNRPQRMGPGTPIGPNQPAEETPKP